MLLFRFQSHTALVPHHLPVLHERVGMGRVQPKWVFPNYLLLGPLVLVTATWPLLRRYYGGAAVKQQRKPKRLIDQQPGQSSSRLGGSSSHARGIGSALTDVRLLDVAVSDALHLGLEQSHQDANELITLVSIMDTGTHTPQELGSGNDVRSSKRFDMQIPGAHRGVKRLKINGPKAHCSVQNTPMGGSDFTQLYTSALAAHQDELGRQPRLLLSFNRQHIRSLQHLAQMIVCLNPQDAVVLEFSGGWMWTMTKEQLVDVTCSILASDPTIDTAMSPELVSALGDDWVHL